MTESLPQKAKRIFKSLRLGELSLVDEPCVPGSDVKVVKAKRALSPDGHESTDNSDREEGQGKPGGAQASETDIAKALAPFMALSTQLEASSITVTDFLQRAEGISAHLLAQTETGGDPVAKSAASSALSIVTETTVNLAELNAAYAALETRVETLQGEATVAKSKLATAEAEVTRLNGELATATETIAKSKPQPTAAEADEAVLKAMPESMREEVLKARAATEATAEGEEIAKAKALGLAEPDAVGKAMRTLRKADAAATEIIEKALKAKSAVSAESEAIFKAYGLATETSADAASDPSKALDAATDAIMKAKPALTREAAYMEAMEANPALYDQIVAKRRVGAALAGQ